MVLSAQKRVGLAHYQQVARSSDSHDATLSTRKTPTRGAPFYSPKGAACLSQVFHVTRSRLPSQSSLREDQWYRTFDPTFDPDADQSEPQLSVREKRGHKEHSSCHRCASVPDSHRIPRKICKATAYFHKFSNPKIFGANTQTINLVALDCQQLSPPRRPPPPCMLYQYPTDLELRWPTHLASHH